MEIVKAAAIVLCVALALSMAACGSSGKVENDADVPGTESWDRQAEVDVTFPLKEPVKLSVFIPQGSDVCISPKIFFRNCKRPQTSNLTCILFPVLMGD